jgi:valyl-tRNA synthetase
LRFGLLAYTLQGRDINLDLLRIVGYRQFCNKIWNAFRFAGMYVTDFFPLLAMNYQILHSLYVSPRDRFILARLNSTTREVNAFLETYQFAAATTSLHSFFMYDFCDVYLELIKPVVSDLSPENAQRRRTTQATLYVVLEQYLRLLHPFMPFVTEELWQRLPHREHYMSQESIMLAPYPKALEEWDNTEVEQSMHHIKEAIHSARSLRVQYKIPNHVKANFFFRSENEEVKAAVLTQANDFCTLAKGNHLLYFASGQDIPKGFCIQVVSDQLSLLVDLTGLIDIETEIARLTKDIER